LYSKEGTNKPNQWETKIQTAPRKKNKEQTNNVEGK